MTEIAALVEKLSLNVEILPVGEDLFVIGTQRNVDSRELVNSISATLRIEEVQN